jgi:hypothetical protein
MVSISNYVSISLFSQLQSILYILVLSLSYTFSIDIYGGTSSAYMISFVIRYRILEKRPNSYRNPIAGMTEAPKMIITLILFGSPEGFRNRNTLTKKEKKVALVACMRKFITILNAMVRDNQPFRHQISMVCSFRFT